MAVFKVGDDEYEIREARGRKGRKATNWLIASFGDLAKGGDAEVGIDDMLRITDSDEFLDNHLEAFVGDKAAKKIDEDATTSEMLAGVLEIVTTVFDSLAVPEVEAAVKNSNDTQEEEG